jgi:putative ABC transport system permease protein
MTPEIVSIGLVQLAIGLVFILMAGVTSLYHALKLERDLVVGTIRTFAQLFLLGYILKFIFNLGNATLILFVFGFMILFAAWEIRSRVKEKQVAFFWPLFVSMVISYVVVTYMVTAVLVNVEPWWKPQYFIPLGGMVIGNSMNAIAIALERLLGELRKRRLEVEAMLCLGADYKEASRDTLDKLHDGGWGGVYPRHDDRADPCRGQSAAGCPISDRSDDHVSRVNGYRFLVGCLFGAKTLFRIRRAVGVAAKGLLRRIRSCGPTTDVKMQ